MSSSTIGCHLSLIVIIAVLVCSISSISFYATRTPAHLNVHLCSIALLEAACELEVS